MPAEKLTPMEGAAVWPADEVERRPIEDLVPYAKNARDHSPEQIGQLVGSIEKWGWTMPVLIDEAGMIIAGHGRVLAAEQMGLREVPCLTARGWSEDKKRAYVIADNQLPQNATWNEELLREELTSLNDFSGLDLGFSADELAEIMNPGTAGKIDPDQAPTVETKVVSELGDIWVLGDHRIMCGSSTDRENVASLLGGVKPNLMVTDPPYGVNYDPEWRKVLGDSDIAKGKVENDDRADWTEAWELFPGNVAYVWHGALHNVVVAASLERAGFDVRSQIVWVKSRAPISRGHYHWQHEPAFYAERSGEDVEAWSVDHESAAYVVRSGNTAGWVGDRKQTTVWFIDHLKSDTGHGTQKPVECMRRPMVNNSRPGDAIYEPFSGSGTTIIAGEQEGRSVYAMELSPSYVDVAVRRWQEFTGRTATLLKGKKAFAAIEKSRAKRK